MLNRSRYNFVRCVHISLKIKATGSGSIKGICPPQPALSVPSTANANPSHKTPNPTPVRVQLNSSNSLWRQNKQAQRVSRAQCTKANRQPPLKRRRQRRRRWRRPGPKSESGTEAGRGRRKVAPLPLSAIPFGGVACVCFCHAACGLSMHLCASKCVCVCGAHFERSIYGIKYDIALCSCSHNSPACHASQTKCVCKRRAQKYATLCSALRHFDFLALYYSVFFALSLYCFVA